MKSTLFSGLLLFLLVVLAGFVVWERQLQAERDRAFQVQLNELNTQIERLEMNMAKARSDMERLEESSIGGLIDDANDALIEGWSAMMNAVGRELESARQTFEQKRREPQTPSGESGNKPDNDSEGAL